MPEHQDDTAALTTWIKQSRGAMTCRLEPCVPLDTVVKEQFVAAGWKLASHVQYSRTVRLDLSQDEENLWMGMKKRGRQEVNYARRQGVDIEESPATPHDLQTIYDLLKNTSAYASDREY